MNIGIIGTGNIAQFLLEVAQKESSLRIVSVYGRKEELGQKLSAKYHLDFYQNIDDFLDSSIDVVVEAATVQVAKDFSKKVLQGGKDLIISSVGVMNNIDFYKDIQATAKEHIAKVYLPFGAIGGLDLLQSANVLGGVEEVSLTTRKPPQALGLEENDEKETVLFKGSAEEAIRSFPKNINVSIILSVTGIGAERTNVTIIADSKVQRNTHVVEATGDFGRFQIKVENEPMPSNPKTSYLAALSILALLKNKDQAMKIGN